MKPSEIGVSSELKKTAFKPEMMSKDTKTEYNDFQSFTRHVHLQEVPTKKSVSYVV